MLRTLLPFACVLLAASIAIDGSTSYEAHLAANKALARAYSTRIGQPGSGWQAYFAETVEFNGERMAPEDLGLLIASLRRSFPDLEFNIIDQIAEGDRVTTWGHFEGTHLGELNGIAPTRRRVEWLGIAVDRMAHGKVVEMWHEMDLWGLMRQLQAPDAPPASSTPAE